MAGAPASGVLEDTTALQREYRRLTEAVLPAQARAGAGVGDGDEDRDGEKEGEDGAWPVHEDHCFQRIVLDALFEDEWYDHVAGRPARESLTADQLREAIAIAESMRGDPERVRELNERSLRYRGKLD